MIELNEYGAAILVYTKEFYEWAERIGYENPEKWQSFLSVPDEADFQGVKIPYRKMVKNEAPRPKRYEYEDWRKLKELYIVTMLYEECGWDEFMKYLNGCDDWVKNEVKNWRPCDAAGGQYRIEDYLGI